MMPDRIFLRALVPDGAAPVSPTFAFLIGAPCGTREAYRADGETFEDFTARIDSIMAGGEQA